MEYVTEFRFFRNFFKTLLFVGVIYLIVSIGVVYFLTQYSVTKARVAQMYIMESLFLDLREGVSDTSQRDSFNYDTTEFKDFVNYITTNSSEYDDLKLLLPSNSEGTFYRNRKILPIYFGVPYINPDTFDQVARDSFNLSYVDAVREGDKIKQGMYWIDANSLNVTAAYTIMDKNDPLILSRVYGVDIASSSIDTAGSSTNTSTTIKNKLIIYKVVMKYDLLFPIKIPFINYELKNPVKIPLEYQDIFYFSS